MKTVWKYLTNPKATQKLRRRLLIRPQPKSYFILNFASKFTPYKFFWAPKLSHYSFQNGKVKKLKNCYLFWSFSIRAEFSDFEDQSGNTCLCERANEGALKRNVNKCLSDQLSQNGPTFSFHLCFHLFSTLKREFFSHFEIFSSAKTRPKVITYKDWKPRELCWGHHQRASVGEVWRRVWQGWAAFFRGRAFGDLGKGQRDWKHSQTEKEAAPEETEEKLSENG